MKRQQLILIHPIDPRGEKVGGIETHLRLLLQRHPEDFAVLLVGVDGIGDLVPGRLVELELGGRRIEFLPVMRYLDEAAKHAAKKLTQSLTFRFTLALWQHLPLVYRLARRLPSSADLQRFEFATYAQALRLPVVQVVHGEGRKDQKMDSLIRKYWMIQSANERIALSLADRILCVNPNIKKRLDQEFPRQSGKAEVMTVSVDTDVYRPSQFDTADGVLRLIFTGRLDAFKDPPLMFRVIRALAQQLDGKVELHYVGTSDPGRFEEFAAIERQTVRHGFRRAEEINAILARMHAGIITSFFEGMPCFMLEVLAAGRPMGCIHLPQYELIVKPGVSGFLVERSDDTDATAERMAAAFVALWRDICEGRIDPAAVQRCIDPFSVDNQLPRVFEIHRQLVGKRTRGPQVTA
jgi:glycosyltransferase involved in cell wall biosynthesis